jgi:hypothetical protein
LLALKHVIFGDNDKLIFFASLLLLLGSLLVLIRIFVSNQILNNHSTPIHYLIFITSALFISIFIGSKYVFLGGLTLLSEYPTWPILIIVVSFLFINIKKKELLFISFLLGLLPFFRANQLLGALFLLALFNLKYFFNTSGSSSLLKIKKSIISISIFVIPILIITIHNIYYGFKFVPLQTSLPLPVNFPLHFSDIFLVVSDLEIRNLFIDQLAGVLATNQSQFLFTLINITQLIYILFFAYFLVWAIKNKSDLIAFMFIPLLFLLPHIFIQVSPRHIIAGYLTMLIMLTNIFSLNFGKKELFLIFKSGIH